MTECVGATGLLLFIMRTTLTIDDDILAVAKKIAIRRSVTIGKAISDLARKGLENTGEISTRNGFPVFSVSKGATPITLDDVWKSENDA